MFIVYWKTVRKGVIFSDATTFFVGNEKYILDEIYANIASGSLYI